MYTVYMHINKINNKKYVGMTSKNPKTRWGKNGNGYSKSYFSSAIKKYGWDNFEHLILFTGLTEEEACLKEIELIKELNLTDRSNGYNVATGGKINCGYHLSDEVKKHLSEINSGEKHPMYNTHRSEETRKKISKARKGIKFTEKHRQKLSKAKKGKQSLNRKSVKQYDLYMNFIKQWDSLEDAQNELHICKSNICRAIKYDRTAGGFKWTY